MTLDDQFVEVLALLGGETAEAEVIHDQQVRCEEPTERFLKGVVDACLRELFEQHVGAAEEHVEASAHGGGPEALRQHGLADADRSDEEDVLVLAQEVEAKERLHLAAIDLDRCTPIKAVKHDAVFKAGLLQMPFERLVVAPLDLVASSSVRNAA